MPSIERSYGIIPLAVSPLGLQVLMVLQKNGTIWTFPKGHSEDGESNLQTAVREAHEETGVIIPESHIRTQVSFEERYRFFKDNELVQKTVVYHPAFIEYVENLKKHADDISKVRWVNLSTARELVVFESKKRLIDEIKAWVNSLSDNEMANSL